MSLALYELALAEQLDPLLRWADGSSEPLAVQRWLGTLDRADRALLARVQGPTLDVGCGPGRLVAGLAAQGRRALGLDISSLAVRLTRRRGAAAARGDIFAAGVPGEGRWSDVLLADGNIGIGGSPTRLLRRCGAVASPQGRVHVEVGAPGSCAVPSAVRLEVGGRVGAWFSWGRVTVDTVGDAAAVAGLQVDEIWELGGRWFAELTHP